MKLRRLVAITIVFFGSLYLASQANALTVSPATVDNDLDPGASVTGVIKIFNDSDQTYTYGVSNQRFQAGGENGEPEIIPEGSDTAINDLKNWLSFTGENRVTLAPGESKDFAYEIKVPQNAEPGGHYAVAFFSRFADLNGESGVGLGAKLGVLFLVNVSGNISEGASFESFEVKNKFVSHLPANFYLRIKNNGTVHFRPKGNISIHNIFGSEVTKIPANMGKNAVLPNSIRRLETWWVKDKDAVQDNGFFSGLQNEWKNFGIGYYKATAYVTWGSKDTEFSPMTVSFWVFPWRLAIVFLAILAVLFGGIKLYNKMIVSSAMKKQKS